MPIFLTKRYYKRATCWARTCQLCKRGLITKSSASHQEKRWSQFNEKPWIQQKPSLKCETKLGPIKRREVNLLQNIGWCETDKTCLFQAKSSLRSALPCFSGKTLSAESSRKTQHSSLCVAKHNIWLDTMLKQISCRILLKTWSTATIILWKRTMFRLYTVKDLCLFVVFNMISTDSEKVSFNCSDKFLEKSGAFFLGQIWERMS